MQPNSFQLKSLNGFEFDELIIVKHNDTNLETADRKNDLNKRILQAFLDTQMALHDADHRPFTKCQLLVKHCEKNANVFFVKKRKPNEKTHVLEITINQNSYTSATKTHKMQFYSLRALVTYMLMKAPASP